MESQAQQQQPITNYITSRGMAHANNPDRIRMYEDRHSRAQLAQREKARAAIERRHDLIKRNQYNPPRSWMTRDISDSDALDLYYQMTYAGKPLVKAHKSRGDDPLSWAQRKEANDARKAAFKAELDRVYSGFSDQRDRELAYAKGRRLARKLQVGEKPKKTAEEVAQDRLRRQYKQIYPNAVLMNEGVDTVLKHFDGEDYTNPVNQEWVGMYPQTMTPQAREKAAKTFAEMTGTLGWMPTYDPKLTTVESAKKVYNPHDYDIRAFDMDMNDFTPANVIIRKKFDIDANGNYVELPEEQWKIVAANGYRLPDPSSKQQYAR